MEQDISKDQLGRRGFLETGLVTFGAAGIAAFAGGALAQPAQNQAAPAQVRSNQLSGVPSGPIVPWSDTIDPEDLKDPPMPEGLKPNASLDARWPVSYRRSVPAACRVLTAHFDAIATRSYPTLARTMHFPFGIIERIDSVVINSPDQLTDQKAPFSLNFAPNGSLTSGTPSRLIPSAYDIMQSLEVLNFDPIRVNMAMTFDRFNRHGFRTARCEGIYCVTNNDGKWAIQMMSTIWKANDHIDLKWPDAEAAALRLRANHDDSYVNDVDIIDHPRPHRGPRIGVARSGGTAFQDAKGDGTADPVARMAGYGARGVKTRLTIGEPVSPDSPSLRIDPADRRGQRVGDTQEQRPKWASETDSWSKVGISNWWEARIAPGARIIHANSDKVHRFAGASRYNAAGERLNISMEVAAVVLGSGAEWVGNGSMAYITVHDRLSDDME